MNSTPKRILHITEMLSAAGIESFIMNVYRNIDRSKIQFDFFNAKRILKDCFPIFAGSFLSFYILNAPKYAIDALLSSELQAYYVLFQCLFL